jgi:hypothetical protein
MAREYMSNYFLTIVEPLRADERALPREAKGYDYYANAADDVPRRPVMEPAVNTYLSIQTWGTPLQILEKLREREGACSAA